jgi:hypothetical protein
MLKHLCDTFPFNMGKNSICSICKASDCGNLTIWLREYNGPKRFYLKDLSKINPYTGDNKRSARGSTSEHKKLYGRIEDLIDFAESKKIVRKSDLREDAFRYILGVDSCLGFNKFGNVDNNQVSYVSPGPHSLQNKVKSVGLFDEVAKDSRVLRSPDEKIRTLNWGRKKSYMD